MLDSVTPRLRTGRTMLSRSVRLDAPEGEAAPGLAELQGAHPSVQIGSYPFFEQGRLGTYVVLRSVDRDALDRAHTELWTLIAAQGFKAAESER